MNSQDRKRLRREVFARREPVSFAPIQVKEPLTIYMEPLYMRPTVFLHLNTDIPTEISIAAENLSRQTGAPYYYAEDALYRLYLRYYHVQLSLL
ncbi:hypothetical protein SDC9_170763 [bioreactor metagenome]|uniref:Uncharacterized protein n=1 Tax=bioreactor metagenome TaxID=1076179 RepID=A0A645G9Q3_9ZZZZ